MLFGLLALVLASVGLYGITSYAVARRTNEIGLRMALGADRGNVVRLVLRGAFVQVGLGLAIGIPIAMLGAHHMADQLYGVSSYDPMSLALARWGVGLGGSAGGIHSGPTRSQHRAHAGLAHRIAGIVRPAKLPGCGRPTLCE